MWIISEEDARALVSVENAIAEVEKLLRKGEGWLENHPARELIVRRYLKGFGGLLRRAASAASFDVTCCRTCCRR